MKKRFLSLALALVMCLGLCIPAFAEEAAYTKSELNGMVHITRKYVSTIYGLGYVKEETLPTRVEGEDRSVSLYRIFGKDDIFRYENTGKEGCKVGIDLFVYKKDSNGVYVWNEKDYELRTTGKFVDYEIEKNDENGRVLVLEPGEKTGDLLLLDFASETLGGDKGDRTYLYELAPYIYFDGDKQLYHPSSRFYMYDAAAVEAINASDPVKAFTDVKEDSSYAEGIRWAVLNGVANGKSSTSFAPGDVCTVSNILTFLWRANDRPGAGDNERDSVVAWANGLGIDTSTLSAPCTRAMAVTYMWKAAGSPAASKSASFTDVAAGADYAQAVAWAVEQKITSGTSETTFAPDNTCTRGQIVTFLYRAN